MSERPSPLDPQTRRELVALVDQLLEILDHHQEHIAAAHISRGRDALADPL